MWNDNAEDRALVTELSRRVVAEIEPDELPLFDDLIAEYFTESTPPAETDVVTDEPLGYSLGRTPSSITPVAATLASNLLNHLLTETLKLNPNGGSQDDFKPKVKALFGASEAEPVDLGQDEMERTHAMIVRQAKSMDLDDHQAKQAADVLLGHLVTSR
jgi:hypothetical protein